MKKPAVVAVVGSKKSGKTSTIETLTRELTKRGYKIAVIKHISEANFTIDTVGKDTWRFAQSGAKTIISVAAQEIATIEKVNTKDLPLKNILDKCKNNDLVFIEGFKKSVIKKRSIFKIVTVKSKEEALEALKNFEPLLAFAGPFSTEKLSLKIPYVDALRNSEKMADIVEKTVLGS